MQLMSWKQDGVRDLKASPKKQRGSITGEVGEQWGPDKLRPAVHWETNEGKASAQQTRSPEWKKKTPHKRSIKTLKTWDKSPTLTQTLPGDVSSWLQILNRESTDFLVLNLFHSLLQQPKEKKTNHTHTSRQSWELNNLLLSCLQGLIASFAGQFISALRCELLFCLLAMQRFVLLGAAYTAEAALRSSLGMLYYSLSSWVFGGISVLPGTAYAHRASSSSPVLELIPSHVHICSTQASTDIPAGTPLFSSQWPLLQMGEMHSPGSSCSLLSKAWEQRQHDKTQVGTRLPQPLG